MGIKKSLLSLLFVIAFILGALPFDGTISVVADEYSGTCGTNMNWVFNSDTGSLNITGSGKMTDYTQGKSPWYSYRSKITSTAIANSVTGIGNYSFYGCSGLTSIALPSSLTSIGEYAFYSTGLTSITIPSKVTSIGLRAFNGYKLTSISVASGNSSYKSSGNCIIHIPSKTLILASKSSTIPTDGSITAIGKYAFADGQSISNVVIPNGVTIIDDYAFNNNNNLRTLSLPEGLVSIGSHAFDGCLNLGNFSLPSTVTTIGDSAFWCAYAVTSITVPAKVTSIGDGAFQACKKLTSLSVNTNNTVYYSKNNCIIKKSTKTLIATCNSSVIPSDSSVTAIGNAAFAGNLIANITIPNGVTSIGNDAFTSCVNLTSAIISNTVKSIGDSAFYNCRSLESIVIPNSVETIGYKAFALCGALTSASIGNSVKTIGDCAFQNCSKMNELTLGSSIVSIGKWAFASCSQLTEITIPDSVKTIDSLAFSQCTALMTLYLGCGIQKIGSSAFQSCNNLSDIFYSGTEEHKKSIDIYWVNSELYSAEWHYIDPIYTLTYSANGGSGAPTGQSGYGNIMLSGTRPTRSGYKFLGWAASASATSAQYQPGVTFNLTKDITLYAVWKQDSVTPTSYTLTYYANNSTEVPASQTGNGIITLSNTKPTRNGYTFIGWATSASATSAQYQPGATFNLTRNTTLYAVWKKIDTPITPSNPTANAKINIKSSATIDYRAGITLTATATGVPVGYVLAVYEGNTLKAKGTNKEVTYAPKDSNGKPIQFKANTTLTVKIIDKNNVVQKDSSGKELTAKCEITVKQGFFDKLIAFFKGLFGSLPIVKI